MEWLCKDYNVNTNKIEDVNILKYYENYIKKLKKKYNTKEDFSIALRKEMMSHYWGRCEYELVIKHTEDDRIVLIPQCGCINPNEAEIDVTNDPTFDWKSFAELHISKQIYKDEAKIDIYSQIEFMWDKFVTYCWEYKHKWQRQAKTT